MRKSYHEDIENEEAYPGNIPGYDIDNAETCLEDDRRLTESLGWSLMSIAKLLMDIRDELRRLNNAKD